MQDFGRIGRSAVLVGALAIGHMAAQEPAVRGAGTRSGATIGGVSAAALAASKEDPAAVDRGSKVYATYCAGCHGNTGRGGAGAPDLVRSLLVLDDEKGILIAPVIRDGRPDEGHAEAESDRAADCGCSGVAACADVRGGTSHDLCVSGRA